MAKSPRHFTAGFTLLEAIVALTVMGLSLIPLMSYISQSAEQLERAADANEKSLVMQSTLALMDPINPMAEPEGRLPLDERLQVIWRSAVVLEPPEGLLVGAPLSGFRLGFYAVHVDVTRDGAAWLDFDMRKVGYVRIQGFLQPNATK